MVQLKSVYENIENPLDNPKMVTKIISAYFSSKGNLYNELVKMNNNRDNSNINNSDKEKFLVEAYNQWIQNIMNLDEKQMDTLQAKGMDIKEIKDFFMNFGEVKSIQDIDRIEQDKLFEKEINGWKLYDGWEHIKSEYLSARQENKIKTKHRLYVGCKNQDMWKMAQLFKEKCEKQNVPFYYKVSSDDSRDDKMVIYSDTSSLAQYIEILQEIGKENPDIQQRCGEPPVLTGKIDGWIGIGDEPTQKKSSYNLYRSEIFKSSIEKVILEDIANFKGKEISYNGKQGIFDGLFIKQLQEEIINQLNSPEENKIFKDGSSKLSLSYGLKEADLSSEAFKTHIRKCLRSSITSGLEKYEELRNDDSVQAGIETILSIPTRDGKKFEISTISMEQMLKSMIPIMQEIDPDFSQKIGKEIKRECEQAGLDDNFCFEKGTKELFEQIDEQNITRTKNPDIKQKETREQKSEEEIGIKEVKREIWNSKITTREKQSQEMDIQKQNRARALFNRSKKGEVSQGEQRLNEENQRQINQAIVEYRNEQDNRHQKRKGNGIEM